MWSFRVTFIVVVELAMLLYFILLMPKIKNTCSSSNSCISVTHQKSKVDIPVITEEMWDEKFDENEVEKFEMKFKDLHINYHFHKNYKNDCDGVKLLIMIFSRPNAFDGRMALRNSWLQNKNSSVIHRFIIGATWNSTIRNVNKKEAQRYKDLIITNIRDSYLNGTLKAHAMYQWQQHYCPDIEYFLKVDDDTVVDISRLQYFIEKDFQILTKKHANKAIFCTVISKALPYRNPNNKWYVPYKIWKYHFFPDYCRGATYLLTSGAIKAILDETPRHHFMHIEDVMFPGIVAAAAEVKLFQRIQIFGNMTWEYECDENRVPYLIAIDEGGNNITYVQGKSNKFTEATKRLSSLRCF